MRVTMATVLINANQQVRVVAFAAMSITVHDPELWRRVMGYEAPDAAGSSSPPGEHPSREEVRTASKLIYYFDEVQFLVIDSSHHQGGITGSRSNPSPVGVHPSSSQLMRAKEWLTRKATRNIVSIILYTSV